MTSAIHHGFDLAAQSAIPTSEISELLQAEAPAWVHLDGTHPKTREWLQASIAYLDPFVVEALTADETRPRLTKMGEGALVILRGVNLSDETTPEDMISIRLYIDASRVISVGLRPLKSVTEIVASIEAKSGPTTASAFLSDIILRLIDKMQPIITELDDRTDAIEEALVETPDVDLRNGLVKLRKQAIVLRRYIAPMRDAVGALATSHLAFLHPNDVRALAEAQNDLTRYIEALDATRERAQIIKDELAAGLADRMNRQMFILSVVAAVFLPLGFITGLLGINVGGVPGTENPLAFWITSAGLIGLAVIIALFFRIKRWM